MILMWRSEHTKFRKRTHTDVSTNSVAELGTAVETLRLDTEVQRQACRVREDQITKIHNTGNLDNGIAVYLEWRSVRILQRPMWRSKCRVA